MSELNIELEVVFVPVSKEREAAYRTSVRILVMLMRELDDGYKEKDAPKPGKITIAPHKKKRRPGRTGRRGWAHEITAHA